MRAARTTAGEQYCLILECRRSGLSDYGWCRENGINPATFYTWITRLKKKGDVSVPPASRPSASCHSQDIVKMDALPEEVMPKPSDDKHAFLPGQEVQTSGSFIEIEVQGVTFRLSGVIDAALYEKTLLMTGGRL